MAQRKALTKMANILAVDGLNAELVSYVKKGMKDPSSFEHVETRFNDKGDHYEIYMQFRGKILSMQ